ncbi:MAG: GtrA family protein [Lachnospiraceae bacterium]
MIKFIRQIARHAMIGGAAFLIDYGLMILLTEVVGFHYLVSASISFIVAVIFNHRYSMRFVFQRREDISVTKEFTIFLILSVIGLMLNTLLLWVIVSKIGIHYMIAKILSTALVTTYNFFSRKIFLEKKEK